MWINTFDVQDAETRKVGEALLFDNAFLVVEWTRKRTNGTPYVTMKSGGQDGMTNWLANNNLQLFWKAISRTEVPNADQKMKLKMAMDSKFSGDLSTIGIMPWAINELGYKTMTTLLGSMQSKEYNKTFVVVIDGGISAFMTMEAFQSSVSGITDYEGGGHNFWIPFMMSGGRSGTEYIMMVEIAPMQANIFIKALKNQTKGAKLEEIMDYVLGGSPMTPLPEFQTRINWISARMTKIMTEEGIDAPEANQRVMNELMRAIKSKKPEVFDNSFTLDGGYGVKGQEYEWPKP